MPTQVLTIKEGRKAQLYVTDTATDAGTYCSATELDPRLGNTFIGGMYLMKPPKNPAALVRLLDWRI